MTKNPAYGLDFAYESPAGHGCSIARQAMKFITNIYSSPGFRWAHGGFSDSFSNWGSRDCWIFKSIYRSSDSDNSDGVDRHQYLWCDQHSFTTFMANSYVVSAKHGKPVTGKRFPNYFPFVMGNPWVTDGVPILLWSCTNCCNLSTCLSLARL